ncbi:DUF2752 domain-containing protein [Chitinophaga sp. LS1]|uniref:DUF2752 domain-containing protein n=1 Tax=Chitinophaga sp. LS1 TaxID=3051176 RepID=UPI0039EF2D95
MLIIHHVQRINKELIIWPVALILLYWMNPAADGNFSLCPFKWLGFTWCPGCGLGHGIHYLLHGDWKNAIHHHVLSPFAVAVLLHRTFQLGRSQLRLKNHHT